MLPKVDPAFRRARRSGEVEHGSAARLAGTGEFDDVLTERDLYLVQAYLAIETGMRMGANSTTTHKN
jgi:hypothetical protein